MHFLDQYVYGLWGSVVFNILMFGGFVFLVFKPQSQKDWRTLGAFTSFLVALFAEMFGFPLTIYILTSILGNRYPVLDPFTHINGHLWVAIAGGSRMVYSILHPLSNILIFAGIAIIGVGWKGIHGGNGDLITDGIYKYVRHPQYSGFMVIILGFIIQWPTIITLIMAPVLTIMYIKLSKSEESVMIEEFGGKYLEYMKIVPRFVPSLKTKIN